MSYLLQIDDLPGEAVLNVGGTLTWYPRVQGTGNVTATTATYELLDAAGTSLGTGSATITAVGTPAVSRVTVPVSAGQAVVLSDLQPNTCRLAWRIAGDTVDRVNVLVWEVVRVPWASEALVSLSDLQTVRPTVGLVLRRQGALLELATGAEAEAAAAGHAYRAHCMVDSMIRARATSQGTVRPRLLFDRARIAGLVEVPLTLSLVFEADARAPGPVVDGGGDDEAASLARWYRAQAYEAWASIGALPYDANDDGVPDSQVEPGASVQFLRRVRGGAWGPSVDRTS